MMPLQEFHLSLEALEAARVLPIDHEGAGGYKRRKDGIRARVEAAIEVERRAGNLFTAADVHRWLERQLMMPTERASA